MKLDRSDMHNAGVKRDARIGVVGATGAVGTVTVELLRQRSRPYVSVSTTGW